MKTNDKLSSMHIIKPLVIKFGIDMLVSFAATIIYVLIHVEERLLQENANMVAVAEAFAIEIQQYTVIITATSSLLLLPILIRIFRRDDFKEERLQTNWKIYPVLIVIAITASVGMNNLMALSQISRIDVLYQNVAAFFYEPTLLTQLLALGLIVPIAEELLFRGIIFRRLRMEFGRKVSICISAFLFGLIHANVSQFIYAFVLGAIFAYLYEVFATIWAPICLHIVANVVIILMMGYDISAWMFSSFFRVGVITVGCAFVCSAMMLMVQEKMLRKC